MRWLGGWVVRGLGLAVGTAAAVASAQPVVGEPAFQVNTFTPGRQYYPDVAAAPSGEFIVTWTSKPMNDGVPAQDGSAGGVFLRAFDATGGAAGPETLVPDSTAGSQGAPAVAIGPGGNALVTWRDGPLGVVSTAYARPFDGAGHATGPAVPVLPTNGRLVTAFDGAGRAFALAQSAGSLSLARLSASGALMDLATIGSGGWSPFRDLAGLPGGGGLVTWIADPGPTSDVQLATFDDGLVLGQTVAVGPGRGDESALATSPSGRALVVWVAQDGPDGPDGVAYYGDGIFGRLVDADGTPLTDAFLINSARAGNQSLPAVASDGKGRFLVSWMNGLGPEPLPVPGRNPHGVNARLFDENATPLGGEFAVAFDPATPGYLSRVAGTAGGDFVVAWEGGRQFSDPGGSHLDVFARRLAAVPCVAGDACDDGDACTTDACEDGICMSRSVPGCCHADVECDDGLGCTEDACVDGVCVNAPVEGCTPCAVGQIVCDDGDPTTRDTCVLGRCVSYCAQAGDCDDGDPCTTDYCVPYGSGCYGAPIAGCERCAADTDCTDWLGCTEDRCVDGRCEFTPIAECAYCAFPADCDSGCLLGPDACVENACVPAAGCPVVIPGEDPAGAAARFQVELRPPDTAASALLAGRPLRAKVKLVLAEDAGSRRCRAGARVGGARGRALPGESTMIEVGLGRRGARCLAQAGDLRLEALVVVKAGRRAVLRRTVELRWHAE